MLALYACANCGAVHVVRAALCMRCADEKAAREERGDPTDFHPVEPARFAWLLRKVRREANLLADAQRIL